MDKQSIAGHICFLRGNNVIQDFDLASLYGVEPRVLKQSVRRNFRRFPEESWRTKSITSPQEILMPV